MYSGSDEDVFESPLPLAGCASLRSACGRACVGSPRERSAPFEFPPEEGWSADCRLTKHDAPGAATAHRNGSESAAVAPPTTSHPTTFHHGTPRCRGPGRSSV